MTMQTAPNGRLAITTHEYVDNFNDSTFTYDMCQCEGLCYCEVVVAGTVFSIHNKPAPHSRIAGRFVYCKDAECETCLQELPF